MNLFLLALFSICLNPLFAPLPFDHVELLGGGPVSLVFPGAAIPNKYRANYRVNDARWSFTDYGVNGEPHAAGLVVPPFSPVVHSALN